MNIVQYSNLLYYAVTFVYTLIDMNLELIVLSISLIHCNIISVDCGIRRKFYLNYFFKVVDHMINQNGWQCMENSNLIYDSIANSNAPVLTMPELDDSSRISIFNNIVQILNYTYNKIFLSYIELLNIVVDICLNFYGADFIEDFYNCSYLLEKAIKNSLTMFESLYNAMTFISYVDLNLKYYKLTSFYLLSNPFATVDNFYEVKNHKYFKQIQNEFLNIQTFLDSKEFIDDISKITNQFFEKNKCIVNNSEKVNSKTIYETEYLSQTNEFPNFLSYVCHKVNLFCTETINNYYKDLGLIELINLTNSKLIPPTDNIINHELGIMALNDLITVGNWDSFNHIEIQCNDLKISAKHVIRDLATDHNLQLKKQYFTQMVRCRFLEVLINYNALLSALKEMCTNEIGSNCYLKCVTCLFNAINDTVKMFDFMLTIIEKLKLSKIWQHNKSYSDLLSTRDLIYNYVVQLKTNDVVRCTFINNNEVNINTIAADYINIFEFARNHFISMLHIFKHPKNNRCYLKGLKMTRKELIIKFKDYANNLNEKLNETCVTDYELITRYFYDFYKNFIKTDYEDTGFDKICQNYFWKWT
ncbi:uncharacterized protein LOC126897050 [Daktulosphaira vitifoliae]|uniref:uncharacterized protein LOC126897050 n=1 Tax=Daktulosphaira vitifoliae TaxID=58002 RepID=UPI0021AAA683|nr:uncharacterized protein LOC126897050 [Daktulosphaira vitifoliae]